MANVVSRIVSCCTDKDGNNLLEVEYCPAGKRSAMISGEQFSEDGGRRVKRLLVDWDKGTFFNISRVSDMRVNKKRCLEFRVTSEH
jgi:methylaspartate ammonia-lyase